MKEGARLNAGLFSSETPEWETPRALFEALASEFGPFDVDVCARPENAKVARFFSPEEDGLKQAWRGRCWMNPPYGRAISAWVRKAREAGEAGARVVCLLPARTDTAWWHDNVIPHARVIRFLRGRVRFGGKGPAPFPSAVVVFDARDSTYVLDGLLRADLEELLSGLRWGDHEGDVRNEARWRALVDRIEAMLEASA